ncbi:MAG: MFS transporter [Hornefia sp.]|nr:MFS transporter [Hornefia sp.]
MKKDELTEKNNLTDMKALIKKSPLSGKDHFAYGSASIGDALAYTMVGSFLMFFLTTVAEIRPSTAGSIIAAGAVWNAFINPVVGFCSDKVKTRLGSRRPMILFFSIPLALSMFLLFSDFPIPAAFKPCYYGIMTVIFWTSYTGFFVPYLALGAMYTEDYTERTKLRLYASAFNTLGAAATMTLPTLLIKYCKTLNFSLSLSWSVAGAITGFITMISIIITFFLSKDKDPAWENTVFPHVSDIRFKAIFREYLDIARLKPMKYLILASACALITYTILMSDMIYFLTYNLGLGPSEISAALLARAMVGVITIPFVSRCAEKFDKKNTIILFYAIAAAGLIFIRFTGVNDIAETALYIFFAGLCTSVYWQLMPSIYYDVCDYDYMENNRNRQGSILSFQGLIEAASGGIGAQLLGIILETSDFKGSLALQTPEALDGIFACTTLLPVVFVAISAYAVYRYPITRKVHGEILAKIKEQTDIR